MPADERAPSPSNPWTMASLPIVVGWVDEDRPLLLAGPPSESDPWTTASWKGIHVVSAEVADRVGRRDGREGTLRRLASAVRAHGWTWLPTVTARVDGSHHALGIAVHGLPRTAAVGLARDAGQSVVLELGPERLRIIDLLSGQITTVRRRHHPSELRPLWLSCGSELLSVWRGQHRAALDPDDLADRRARAVSCGDPT